MAILGASSAAFAQELDGPVALGTSSFASSSASVLPDCAAGATVTQDVANGAYGTGNTATATGGPQELGQSFTAPCTGTLVSISVAVQNAAGVAPQQEVKATVSVYSGGNSVASARIATGDYTFNLPPAQTFNNQSFPISGNLQLVENSLYSFFVDVTNAVNYATQANDTNPYSGGALLFSSSGTGAGAFPQATLDLRFEVVLGPPMNTAGEDFEALGYELSAPRPNPTTGVSRMDLTVASVQDVRMTAHDALGRQVAVLHDGPVAATQPVDFDTAGLAPGVYVIRAVGATFATTQRVTVVR